MSDGSSSIQSLAAEQSVLIVRQTRAAHAEIQKIIDRVESGDDRFSDSKQKRKGGMGGFGGGMFNVQSEPPRPSRSR